MAIRSESRWWIVALLLVGVLFTLSALALDKPDVVWAGHQPWCPQCRSEVRPFSTRCGVCREEFDWYPSGDAESPISTWSLSPLEEELLRGRVKALGEDVAVARLAQALNLTPSAATQYLKQVGSGRCGWCGGNGTELGTDASRPVVSCPVCFGRRACPACGGDRRIRLGDEAAARDLTHYLEALRTLSPTLSLEVQRAEVRRLGEAFLGAHAGTREAQQVVFAPTFDVARGQRQTSVEAARGRLEAVLAALSAP